MLTFFSHKIKYDLMEGQFSRILSSSFNYQQILREQNMNANVHLLSLFEQNFSSEEGLFKFLTL